MRWILPAIAIAALIATGVAAQPYEFERVAGHVSANPTGCIVDVQNYSGWKQERGAIGLLAERVADPIEAYAFIYGCPGTTGGRPAALEATGGAKAYAGESCGVGLKSDYVCRVRIPVAPGRYRLLVRVNAGAHPKSIVIDVERKTNWRSTTWDGMMSV